MPVRALLTAVVCGLLVTSCGESPTGPADPAPIDPEVILREEMARQGLSPSWFPGCIRNTFVLHLPTYQGKSFAFILADIRAIIAGCLADDGEPENGDLEVTTATSGEDLDADGYTLSVDGGSPQAIGTNAVVTIQDLAPGSHQVELTGVAANCSVAPDNPRSVDVPEGGTAQTTFAITCEALPPTVGALDVVTTTSGEDLDQGGYSVTVGGGSATAIGVQDTVNFAGLTPGNYDVELSGVAANCTVGGDNPRSVAVSAGTTAETTFTVTCEALPPTVGALDVVTSTGGTDVDLDGYTVTVGGGTAMATGANDTLNFTDLTPGDYDVQLEGVADNCTVDGDNPRTVAVTAGTTAETTFDVTCSEIVIPPDQIVFSRISSGLWIINDDGSGETQLTTVGDDQTPDVSPDGTRIVFSSTNGGSQSDIFTTDIDGSNRDQLTDASTDGGQSFDPEFSPDGTKIVFHSDRGVGGTLQVWVMNADGSNPVQLTASGNNAWASWSPDGNKIAFSSDRDGNFEIYVMDADGSNETRLTNNAAAEFDANFSPDGTKIAFDSNRNAPGFDIFVMDADGSNQTALTSGSANSFYPSWSPDGQLIAFTSDRETATTIWLMEANGANQVEVSSTGDDFFATWVP